MKIIVLLFSILLLAFNTKAQFGGGKFEPGYYYDINGQKVDGFIDRNPSGKGIVKNEGFIVFKEEDKAPKQRLSASMIHGFVVAKDSFTIAHAPQYGAWSKNELDFVKVIVNGPTKLYAINGNSNGGGGSGIRLTPALSTGIGTGGSSGIGSGVGITLGGGGGGSGGGTNRITYYYGESTTTMVELKPQTFIDVMTDIMGDEPQVVEKIRNKTFNYNNMDSLVKYFKQIESSHKTN